MDTSLSEAATGTPKARTVDMKFEIVKAEQPDRRHLSDGLAG